MLASANDSVLLSTIGDLLILAGGIGYLVGTFKMLVVTRRIGAFWFIGCLFSPLLAFYCLAHWPDAKEPILLWLAGVFLMLVGVLIRPA